MIPIMIGVPCLQKCKNRNHSVEWWKYHDGNHWTSTMSQVPKGEERHPYACKQPGRESQQMSSWPIQKHFRWAAPLNDLPLLLLHLLKQTVSSPQLESYLSEEKYINSLFWEPHFSQQERMVGKMQLCANFFFSPDHSCWLVLSYHHLYLNVWIKVLELIKLDLLARTGALYVMML